MRNFLRRCPSIKFVRKVAVNPPPPGPATVAVNQVIEPFLACLSIANTDSAGMFSLAAIWRPDSPFRPSFATAAICRSSVRGFTWLAWGNKSSSLLTHAKTLLLPNVLPNPFFFNASKGRVLGRGDAEFIDIVAAGTDVYTAATKLATGGSPLISTTVLFKLQANGCKKLLSNKSHPQKRANRSIYFRMTSLHPKPVQLAFAICRVNDYDLQIVMASALTSSARVLFSRTRQSLLAR